jgi:citrate synthase
MSKKLRSDLAWSTADRIVVGGLDLTEDLIGKVSLGDMAFLELKGRLPSPRESVLFNAITVTLVEHGMTPSAIVARLTYFGAPESLQGAVAAGLLGMGDRFGGSVEAAARMLQEGIQKGIQEGGEGADAELRAVARAIVSVHRAAGRPVPGIGHPVHKGSDPRTVRLFALAAEHDCSGRYVALMEAVAEEASAAHQRHLPVNATGAIGALASELDIPWRVSRGLAVIARAIGLVAHVQEEIADPIAAEIWSRVEDEASEHLREGGHRRPSKSPGAD